MGFGGLLKDFLIFLLFILVIKSWIFGQGITLKIGVLSIMLFVVAASFRFKSI